MVSQLIITDDSVPSRNNDVIERFGEEDLLLFHSSFGKLFEVNRVGREIWSKCDGSLTVRKIKKEISGRFSSSDTVGEDVERFISRLFDLNLIHVI
ncbi:MAG: PqqD family protein [Candidatus Geothermarchaeales archaeon]